MIVCLEVAKKERTEASFPPESLDAVVRPRPVSGIRGHGDVLYMEQIALPVHVYEFWGGFFGDVCKRSGLQYPFSGLAVLGTLRVNRHGTRQSVLAALSSQSRSRVTSLDPWHISQAGGLPQPQWR